MDIIKTTKKLLFFVTFLSVSILVFAGYGTYYGRPAYSQGFLGINIGVAAPNFVFSFGDGVNTYYAPMYNSYIYGYNGYYFRWYNNGWIYASGYPGPWYSVPPTFGLPGILSFGPPPPMVNNEQYFTWWTGNVGPWYRTYHPDWWNRNHMYMRNYGQWRAHAGRFYYNRPYQSWGIRRQAPRGRNMRGPQGRIQQQRGPQPHGRKGPNSKKHKNGN